MSIEHECKTVKLDNDGYLANKDDWDDDVARFLATRE